jgi:ATP-dependent helicase HrpA
VRAFQQVTLFGLVIVPRRSVSYDKINPKESHAIFVQSALVEGDVNPPLPFLVQNQRLLAELGTVEHKLRRRDLLVSDSAIAEFYSERLQGVCDVADLKKRIRERGGDDFLRLQKENLLLKTPGEAELSGYPDVFTMGGRDYACEYTFAPGKEEDGVTLKVPSGLISTVPAECLDWGVPGLLREKVTALIKGLPKRYRKLLVPVSRTVDEIMKHMEREDGTLLHTLSAFVYRHFSVDIPASVWSGIEVPEHLRMRVAVVDHAGKELESGRDIHLLSRSDRHRRASGSSTAWENGRRRWERQGITTWDFGELPESLSLGEHLIAYPALEPAEESLNLVLFRNREEATASHRKGVRRLLTRHFSKDLKYLRRNLALPRDAPAAARYFGGAVTLEEAMTEHLLSHSFERNLRSADDLEEGIREIGPGLLEKGKALKEQVLRILDAHEEVRIAVQALEGPKEGGNELSRKIREELDTLVPPDFLERYDGERLDHLPRYLKALQIRAERGLNDPEKHRLKTAQVEAFVGSFQRIRQNLSPHAGKAKREALEEFRWMIEEFKVSLFAQELKTAFPVSQKRLEQKEREIERMV